MNYLLDTNFSLPKTISPISLSKKSTQKIPNDNYLKRILNYGIAPPHFRSRELDYCTTLPPSPKNNIDNDPACIKCKKYPNRPFKRKKCYMLYSPQQNIWGPICGDGGSNANWIRGNRFGVDYEYDKIFKRQDYEINLPRFIKKNPVLVSDSPYFPLPDYGKRFNPKYKSYPYTNNYINGKPTITYPYATLDKKTKTTIENFRNISKLNKRNNLLIIIIILVLIFVIFLYIN
jgi:hypothetical protein